MNILIADDHAVVRRGLQTIVATQPGWTVAGEVSSADEVLPALRRYRFDVLILDLAMGGGRSGMDLLAQIRSEFPSLPVLMLSACIRRSNTPSAACVPEPRATYKRTAPPTS
jgi:two-component system response regulator NreC